MTLPKVGTKLRFKSEIQNTEAHNNLATVVDHPEGCFDDKDHVHVAFDNPKFQYGAGPYKAYEFQIGKAWHYVHNPEDPT